MIAAGGCDPDDWEDIPDPLPLPLQNRLLTLCTLAGADLERTDATHKATALGWACWFGCRQGANALVQLGADRHAQDVYHTTPVINAMMRHGWELSELTEPLPSTGAACGYTRQAADDAELRQPAMWHEFIAMRRLHAGWSEAHARTVAAMGARLAAQACEGLTESILPGPALQAVADTLMRDTFKLWSPFTRPVIFEFMQL